MVKILLFALDQAGYNSSPELELGIDQNWQPNADVAAWTRIDGPYPTRPVDIVVEVLSLEDRMQRVIAKCRNYQRVAIPSIFVMDPEFRDAWKWSSATQNLERISSLNLPNGNEIPVDKLWLALAQQLENE